MKDLATYIRECGGICATPANTTGMGNPMPPTETENGSEPILPTVPIAKRRHKKKREEIVKQ